MTTAVFPVWSWGYKKSPQTGFVDGAGQLS